MEANGNKKPAKKKSEPKEWPSNCVELSGYAASDPIFQKKGNNRMIARFTLGTHQLFRDSNGQWVRTTVWHTIVTWDYAARKTIEMVRRGSFVSLTGKLRCYRSEKADGITEDKVYIIASGLTVNIAA